MSEFKPRPEPPVLKWKGFTLCETVFSVKGILPVEGSRLRELFDPSTLRLHRDRMAAIQDAEILFNKIFFDAQLRHYGIEFKKSLPKDELELLLRDAVLSGKCNTVPQGVISLQQAMRRDYQPLFDTWKKEAAAWDADKKRRDDDEAWNRLQTPSERARVDFDRFLELYFLTDGKPDASKTPEPLTLYGNRDRWMLHAKAERVPGLYTARAEKRDAEWSSAMDGHRQFVAKAAAKKPGKTFDLSACRGSYIVRCETLSSGWNAKDMTIDITDGESDNMLEADFDFAIYEGAMVLSQSQAALERLVEANDDESSKNDSDSGDDSEGDSGEDTEEDEKMRRRPGKRKAAPTRRGPGRPKKQVKEGKPKGVGRRVFIRMRGGETSEGQIYPEPKEGYLDFTDNACVSFKGVVGIPFAGSNVQLEGFKVSDVAENSSHSWSEFSESAYEHTRVSRWV